MVVSWQLNVSALHGGHRQVVQPDIVKLCNMNVAYIKITSSNNTI
jgi:hypothetical protein